MVEGIPYLIKTIRNDEFDFWPSFVDSVTISEKTVAFPQKVRRPLRRGNKGDYKYLSDGQVVSRDYQQFTPAQKKLFSKKQSFSYIRIDPEGKNSFCPPFFGFNKKRNNCLVGVIIPLENTLISRIMGYDGGTYRRPYYFSDKRNALQAYEIKKPLLYTNLDDLGKSDAEKMNEVLARVKWTDKCAVIIFTNNLESRLLAQLRARDMEERLWLQNYENKKQLIQVNTNQKEPYKPKVRIICYERDSENPKISILTKYPHYLQSRDLERGINSENIKIRIIATYEFLRKVNFQVNDLPTHQKEIKLLLKDPLNIIALLEVSIRQSEATHRNLLINLPRIFKNVYLPYFKAKIETYNYLPMLNIAAQYHEVETLSLLVYLFDIDIEKLKNAENKIFNTAQEKNPLVIKKLKEHLQKKPIKKQMEERLYDSCFSLETFSEFEEICESLTSNQIIELSKMFVEDIRFITYKHEKLLLILSKVEQPFRLELLKIIGANFIDKFIWNINNLKEILKLLPKSNYEEFLELFGTTKIIGFIENIDDLKAISNMFDLSPTKLKHLPSIVKIAKLINDVDDFQSIMEIFHTDSRASTMNFIKSLLSCKISLIEKISDLESIKNIFHIDSNSLLKLFDLAKIATLIDNINDLEYVLNLLPIDERMQFIFSLEENYVKSMINNASVFQKVFSMIPLHDKVEFIRLIKINNPILTKKLPEDFASKSEDVDSSNALLEEFKKFKESINNHPWKIHGFFAIKGEPATIKLIKKMIEKNKNQQNHESLIKLVEKIIPLLHDSIKTPALWRNKCTTDKYVKLLTNLLDAYREVNFPVAKL